MWSIIAQGAAGWAAQFFKGRQEISKQKAQAKIMNTQAHLNGWSDEVLLIVWSYPFISLFVPQLRADTFAAFEALNALPEWYVGGFISITFAVFGIDKIFKYKTKS